MKFIEGKVSKDLRSLFQGIVDFLIKEEGIKEISYHYQTSGYCEYKTGKIAIPHPTSFRRLIIAIHEIGHYHLHYTNGGYKGKKRFFQEWEAEMYALEKLKFFGFDQYPYEREWGFILESMRCHIIYSLAKAKNRNFIINGYALEQEGIQDFIDIDISKWKKAHRVYISETSIIHEGSCFTLEMEFLKGNIIRTEIDYLKPKYYSL